MELILSIVALAAGPLLFPVVRKHPRLLCGMDGFVMVAIAGLAIFHLLPTAIDHAGSWSLLTALAGVLGPFLFGRNLPHGGQRNVHNIFILVAVAGLAFHAMIDGAAIFHGTHSHGAHDMHLGGMVVAVLIHRVPMSMLVWWSLRPRMGIKIAASALGGLALATGAGYLLGGEFHFTPTLMGHLVAFVAGSLVHVVAHDTASDLIPRHCHDEWHATYSGIGGAVAAVGLVFFGHMYRFEPAWERFVALFVESAPALLIGFTLGGLMEAGFGTAVLEKLGGKSRVGSALRGVFLGTPIPICSCGVETVYRALCTRGVPIAAMIAFLLAAPGMTLDSIALSVELLGVELTVARVAFTAVVAVGAAILVSLVARRSDPEEQHELELGVGPDASLSRHARESIKLGWVEQIDHVAPWVLVGFAGIALLWPALQTGALSDWSAPAEIALLVAAATPLYLNVSAMTALGAALVANGVSAAAVLAMLVTSASLSLPVLAMVGRLHGARAAWLLVGTALGLTVVLALGFDALDLMVDVPLQAATLDGPHAWYEWAAAAVLSLLILASYFRMGPRGMVVQLLPSGHHHLHDHGHPEEAHVHGEHGHHGHHH